MKRVSGIVAVLVFVAGCQSKSAPTASDHTAAPEKRPVTESPAASGLTATSAPAAAPPPAVGGPRAAEGGGGPTGAAKSKASAADRAAAKPEAAPAATSESDAKRWRRPQQQPTASLLTAGVWDDARNFEFFTGFTRSVAQRGIDFDVFTKDELESAQTRSTARRTPKRQLDVALVFDTTGSMGDELRFVQNEIESIAARITDRFPGVEPRFALTAYKDRGDTYVARAVPFTSNIGQFKTTLLGETASGGGDYPEAVVEGLREASHLAWRGGGDVAKVAFWIGDAPSHPGEGRAFGNVVRDLSERGVRLYPIAASGADDLTEYEMRTAALMTGGRYIFLTDDSGVGNSHAEPHIPCYSVTKLDRAIFRMLASELSGETIPLDAQEVIRTVGAPNSEGTCRLTSGQRVAAF